MVNGLLSSQDTASLIDIADTVSIEIETSKRMICTVCTHHI